MGPPLAAGTAPRRVTATEAVRESQKCHISVVQTPLSDRT